MACLSEEGVSLEMGFGRQRSGARRGIVQVQQSVDSGPVRTFVGKEPLSGPRAA